MYSEGLKPSENHTIEALFLLGGILFLSQFALTHKQRASIIERDGGKSQMRHYTEGGGFAPMDVSKCKACNGKGCTLHVHHIEPQRTGGKDEPKNLLTTYKCEHIGQLENGQLVDPAADSVIHPDMIDTLKRYRKGDKNAFVKMFLARNAKIAQGEPYWNTIHDDEMLETARERTQTAIAKGWRFPFSRKKSQKG